MKGMRNQAINGRAESSGRRGSSGHPSAPVSEAGAGGHSSSSDGRDVAGDARERANEEGDHAGDERYHPGDAPRPGMKPSCLVLAGALGVGAVVLVVAGWSPRGFGPQIHETVSRQPTPFTELYFTSPSTLPKVVVPGGPSDFGFTIVNHERDATTYRYLVSAATSETSQAIASGEVTLPTGTGTSLSVRFVPAVLGVDYVVTVQLANRVETIHFATRS